MCASDRSKVTSRALILALVSLSATILISLSRWTLVEYLTPFIEPLLEIGVGLFFAVSLIWSAVHFITSRRYGILKAATPLAVNLITVLLVILVPFTELTTRLNFRIRLKARTTVVRDVLAGKYENRIQSAGGRGDLIALPSRLSGLSSSGGEIVRFRRRSDTLILFFDYRGILDSFSGSSTQLTIFHPSPAILEVSSSKLTVSGEIGSGFHREIREVKNQLLGRRPVTTTPA